MTITDKHFEILYNGQTISVTSDRSFKLSFPGGRWLVLDRHPNDAQTTPVENPNISYSTSFVWVIKASSEDPEWLNKEQVQAIGELIKQKKMAQHQAR